MLPRIFILSLLLLSACASKQEIAAAQARQDAADSQECIQLGFKPATEAYGNCRLRVKEMRVQASLSRSYDRAHTCFGMGFGAGRYDF